METIHSRPSWYAGKKRPTLQIKILQEILPHGQLSKIEFERLYKDTHFHADIISAFDNLKHHKLIEESDRRCHRGQMEILYSLSTAGILALFSENPSSESFWKILVSWCSSNKAPDSYTLDIVYSNLMSQLIGHTFPNLLFSSQLSLFDKLLIRWFKDKRKFSSTISPSQIVLECLATNTELSFENLLEISHLSKDTLNSVLDEFTIKQSYSSLYHLDESDYYNVDKRTEEYLDFMMHCIIVKKTKKIVSYQLSLVGIMFVMVLIRYSDMTLDNLSHHLQLTFAKPIKLFLPLPIQDYYAKIASIHENKLPLIFGIWSSLEKILGVNLVYSLDTILDKKSRDYVGRSPLLLGGIGEVYHYVEGIITLKQIKLRDIHDEGIKQLGSVYNRKDNKLIKRLNLLFQKFKEIGQLMNYISLSSFLDSLQNENFSSDYNWKVNYDNHTNFIISSLKQEVSLLFFLILGTSSIDTLLPLLWNQNSPDFVSREGLAKIIKEYPIVKDMLNPWLQEIREYHYKTSDLIDNLLGPKDILH